jgi:hypothetical protein
LDALVGTRYGRLTRRITHHAHAGVDDELVAMPIRVYCEGPFILVAFPLCVIAYEERACHSFHFHRESQQ